MGFIPHLGFIYRAQLHFAGYTPTSLWDKSPYPMAGCLISYNVQHSPSHSSESLH